MSVDGRREASPVSGYTALSAGKKGLRLVSGSPIQDVVDDVDCSVVLAEQAHDRSLF